MIRSDARLDAGSWGRSGWRHVFSKGFHAMRKHAHNCKWTAPWCTTCLEMQTDITASTKPIYVQLNTKTRQAPDGPHRWSNNRASINAAIFDEYMPAGIQPNSSNNAQFLHIIHWKGPWQQSSCPTSPAPWLAILRWSSVSLEQTQQQQSTAKVLFEHEVLPWTNQSI